VFAQEGSKAATAAKEAAVNMQAYLHDLEKSGGQPDYSKPPASEYFKRIFDTDTLAALPALKAEDLGWMKIWMDNASQIHKAMVLFGAKNQDIVEEMKATARNLSQNDKFILSAEAFTLRLEARGTSLVLITFNEMPPNQHTDADWTVLKKITLNFMVRVINNLSMMTDHQKPENLHVLVAALRDTVTVWAPLLTPPGHADILVKLDKARIANKDAGIDDDINAITATIKNMKE
jgi:hypothetical protein